MLFFFLSFFFFFSFSPKYKLNLFASYLLFSLETQINGINAEQFRNINKKERNCIVKKSQQSAFCNDKNEKLPFNVKTAQTEPAMVRDTHLP